MNQKKNPNRVTLYINDRELKMVEEIKEREGQRNLSTVFHECMRHYYNKIYYTKYNEKKVKPIVKTPDAEPELTPEQLCEQMGGEVVTDNFGNKTCQFTTVRGRGETIRNIPIKETSRFEDIARQMGKIK